MGPAVWRRMDSAEPGGGLGKLRGFARTVALGMVVFLELDWTPPASASGARIEGKG